MPYPTIMQPTRRMIPNMFGNPYTNQLALQQDTGENPLAPAIPSGASARPNQLGASRGTGQRIPLQRHPNAMGAIPAASGQTNLQGLTPPAPPAETKVEITPFINTLYESMKNIDPEQRSGYLQNATASIKDRMDRYEFRLARGIPLTPEQQRRYDSLKASFNDIQKYINNPQPYEDVMGGAFDEREAQRQRYMMSGAYKQSHFPAIAGGSSL